MACEGFLPSANFSSNFVPMECFRGQQLEDAINCLHKFTALQEKDTTDTPLLQHCSVHPQMKSDLYCKQCGVDVCRECTTTRHRRHEYAALSDKIHEETRKVGETMESEMESMVCHTKSRPPYLVAAGPNISKYLNPRYSSLFQFY